MSNGQDITNPSGAPDQGKIPTIPEHTLLRRIGKGSYGEIWLARSVLGTYRAVKLIHRRALQDHEGATEESGRLERA